LHRSLKIAIIPSSNPILECMELALRDLGVSLLAISVVKENNSFVINNSEIEKLVQFKPDFVFFIARTGLLPINREGGLTNHLLDELQIRYVIFYFDFPRCMPQLCAYSHNFLQHIFTWDRTHVDIFKYYGFSRVSFLPLAYSTQYFSAPASREKTYDICFIGFLFPPKDITQFYNSLNARLKRKADELLNKKIKEEAYKIFVLDNMLASEQLDQFTHYFNYINYRYNNYKRKSYISYLSKSKDVHVFGDELWREVAGITVHSPVNYKEAIVSVFANSKINLNFTSAHNTTALTQRIFDCFGSGEFLLSDRQDDNAYLFSVDNIEIPTFSSKSDLVDKVNYFLSHPEERFEIVQRTQKVVLEKHTWECRMKTALDILLKN